MIENNKEKEIIANALLGASQNLINKMDINIKEIEKLKSDLKGSSHIKKGKEKNKNSFGQEENLFTPG